jgi:hypothetical protein
MRLYREFLESASLLLVSAAQFVPPYIATSVRIVRPLLLCSKAYPVMVNCGHISPAQGELVLGGDVHRPADGLIILIASLGVV